MAFSGFCASSPSAPAPSNPAKARKPNTEPRISACTFTPAGRVKMLPVSVPPFRPWPWPTLTRMITISTRIKATVVASMYSSARVERLISPAAKAHRISVIGSASQIQSALCHQPRSWSTPARK